MPTAPDDWVRVGTLGRPHGIKGEMSVHLDNPDGDVLRDGVEIRLVPQKGAPRVIVVQRVFAGGAKLGLTGIDSRDSAEQWRMAQVEIRRADFPDLDDDEAYLVDLVGYEVRTEGGTLLGVIASFSDNRAQPLAHVKTPTGDVVLSPFVEGIVTRIEDEARTVFMDPPEGLFFGDAIEVARSAGDDDEADSR